MIIRENFEKNSDYIFFFGYKAYLIIYLKIKYWVYNIKKLFNKNSLIYQKLIIYDLYYYYKFHYK